mmetsp:Transcript_4572/g.20804  ORF Transcript_4572/g.20804 Transcript_4572/m.20804 type:complete len:205 (+) Transcript_4572:37-651(+)
MAPSTTRISATALRVFTHTNHRRPAHRYELLTSSNVISNTTSVPGGIRVPSVKTAPRSPNAFLDLAVTTRTPPLRIVRTPSSSAGHTGGIKGLRSYVNAMGRLVRLVSMYTTPSFASVILTFTPTKSPFFGVDPPPTRRSAATRPSSGGPRSNSVPDPSPSRAFSSTAFNISPPSTDASKATKPSPPTMPKRRVSHLDAVAAGS